MDPLQVNQVTAFIDALVYVLDPRVLAFIFIGLMIGIILAATPGVGGILGMVIVLPLTIPLSGLEASIIIVSIFAGSMYGASIASILFNVPGTVAAAATTFDGYALTRQGRALDALAISATASALGGTLTMLVLFLLVPYLPPIVGAFETPHIFLLAVFGIVIIGVIASQGSLLKGVASGLMGLLVMTTGVSPASATPRFTFGILTLYSGLDFVAIVIGMFALGEMLRIGNRMGTLVEMGAGDTDVEGSVMNGIMEVIRSPRMLVKSGFIGMFVGAIPGVGGATSNFFSYAEAIRSAKNPESFGNGNPKGVIAAEASNNGTVAGSLMPLIAFGIPGSASTAILLGAFFLHGVDPGPPLFTTNIDFTFALIMSLIVGNVIILVFGNTIVPRTGELITRLNVQTLVPFIIVLGTLGAFTLRYVWIDLVVFFVFGVLAFGMQRYDYSIIALVLGAVLANIVEVNLQRSLVLSDGSPLIFVSDPLGIILSVTILIFFYVAIVRPLTQGEQIELQ